MLALGVDNTRFKVGLKKSENLFGASLRKMRSNAAKTLAAGVGAAALTSASKGILNAADNIDNLRQQLNATVDEIQRLDIAFQEAGLGGVESLVTGIEALNRARREAVEGNEQFRESFQALGISMEEANDGSVRSIQLLEKMARLAPNLAGNTRLRAAATDLLGTRAGRMLGAVTAAGGEGVAGQSRLSSEDVRALDLVEENVSRFTRAVKTRTARVLAKGFRFFGFGEGEGRPEQAIDGQVAETQSQKARRLNAMKIRNEILPDLRTRMAELSGQPELLGVRQSGIDTRSIGGLAFAQRPDQIITIQNKQLTELQEHTRKLSAIEQKLSAFTIPL